MPFEVFFLKLVAMGMVTGLAYAALNLLRGYGKRWQVGETQNALDRQAEDMIELRNRCEELEQRLDSAERRLLRADYRLVITPSEGS